MTNGSSRWRRIFIDRWKLWMVFGAMMLVFWLHFPSVLFDDPTSTLLLDRHGQLLSARIARDGQWRFPECDSVPKHLEQAVLTFEDAYFYWHPGVNPFSLARAFFQNLTQGKVVSGGSTLSMQLIRMSRKNPPRSYLEKLYEIYLALRLEFSYSKEDILRMYVSHAPYGGNVVGAEAAAWRYYNRPPDRLSWAETALLAVLPNAPSLLRPGRNADLLKAKRDRLLLKLHEQGILDETSYSLALMEPIPLAPAPLPSGALHALDFGIAQGKEGKRIASTLDPALQERAVARLNQHTEETSQNEIDNACALIVSVKTGEILAYVGNASIPSARARYVDLIHAPRSSGSILKPFLYGLSFQNGLIHPSTLVRDVPITIGKYAPENYEKKYAGVVEAQDALARSLNIPAALLLRRYGLPQFYTYLKDAGFTTINRPVGGYGLTLILGGAETNLWDLARVYCHQANHLARSGGRFDGVSHFHLWKGDSSDSITKAIHPGAWWQVSEALTAVQRPGSDKDWRRFASSKRIAWKTGTSHGFRDAWAVGYDAEYLVAVWVGNADGEGRPGLTGLSAAAPLMFSLFELLPRSEWFYQPDGFMHNVQLCEQTGQVPNQHCPRADRLLADDATMEGRCEAHQHIYLNAQGLRAHRSCANALRDTTWFHLDPVAGYFYAQRHPLYRPMPTYAPACEEQVNDQVAIIYPQYGATIFPTRSLSGEEEMVQFKATHTQSGATLYWHLDADYIGMTEGLHELLHRPDKGQHVLRVMDEQGNSAVVKFKAVGP